MEAPCDYFCTLFCFHTHSMSPLSPTNRTMSNKKVQVKYKKAPQAPRRFKSSYMFYSTEKHRLIRQQLAEKGDIDKVRSYNVWKNICHPCVSLCTGPSSHPVFPL